MMLKQIIQQALCWAANKKPAEALKGHPKKKG
jgi:hypothetical protein